MTLLSSILAVAALLSTHGVVLSNRCGRTEVSLIGAQIVSYVPAGGAEVLFLPADRDFSRDREMHGGIPVCWPWFSRHGEPLSRMHGLARYARWTVEEKYEEESFSRLVLSLESSEKSRAVWPYDFRLRYTITLADRLSLSLLSENTADPKTASGKWFEFTQGFHPYFRVADARQVSLSGVTNDSLRALTPIDSSWNALGDAAYCLEDEKERRMIRIGAKGHTRVVVWNPGEQWDQGDTNLPSLDWPSFICVEPVSGRREEALRLQPGQRARLDLTVQVVSGRGL